MIGIIMLMGAWFLIHQQCCVADAGVSSRNIMVDPLMRRSPLEKNFIRFGRSETTNFDSERNSNAPSEENARREQQTQQLLRDIRGKENFIRFGRAQEPFVDTEHQAMPSSSSSVFGRFSDVDWPARFVSRITRSKQNFIRFGRSDDPLNKSKKKLGLTSENFIRFGRRVGDIDLRQPDINSNDKWDGHDNKKSNKGSSGFIRFGRSNDSPPSFGQGVREKRDVEPSTDEDDVQCVNRKPPNFDPMMMVAPEFLLMPKIPFQKTPLKENFVRLG